MKNVSIYDVELPNAHDMLNIITNPELKGLRFIPCTENQSFTIGLDQSYDEDDELTKMAMDKVAGSQNYKLTFLYEYKDIKAKIVTQQLEKRLSEFKKNMERDPDKEERAKLKDEVRQSLIRSTVAERQTITAWYHVEKQVLILSTQDKYLCDRVMHLILRMVSAMSSTTLWVDGLKNSLTEFVRKQLDDDNIVAATDFALGNKIKLVIDGCKSNFNGDFLPDVVLRLLDEGYQAEEIEISRDGLTYMLTADFKIKSIAPTFTLPEEMEEESDRDPAEILMLKEATILELLVKQALDLKELFTIKQDGEAA